MKKNLFPIFCFLSLIWSCGSVTTPADTSGVFTNSAISGPQSSKSNNNLFKTPDSPHINKVYSKNIGTSLKQKILEIKNTSNNFSKINPALIKIVRKLKEKGITLENAKRFGAKKYSTPLVKINDSAKIQVYIYLKEFSSDVLDILKGNKVDIEVVNENLKIIQGWLPYDAIHSIADLPFVKKVDVPSYAVRNEGSSMSEGDPIHQADKLRSLGIVGSGVKVGVISDGVNNIADAVATGDLPPDVTVFGACTSGDNTCNEGTAMLEIIHDLAPGAELGFGAVATSLEFIDRLNDLATGFDADIIVDDLIFPGEPMHLDGPVAEAVRNTVNNGSLHISSAGNYAQSHFWGAYLGSLDTPMNFGAEWSSVLNESYVDDQTMNVLLPPGGTLTVYFQWSAYWDTSDSLDKGISDYGIILIDDSETVLLDASDVVQDGDDNPFEAFSYTNPFPASFLWTKIVVYKNSGDQSSLRLILKGDDFHEYNIPTYGIFGHPAIPEVLTVGAINASDEGNNDIAPYSSTGPARLGYPSPYETNKPDLVAIDGVSVTGVGGFTTPFYGTSAAAPHVAGLAALLFEISGNPNEVRNALKTTAIDLSYSDPHYNYHNFPPPAYNYVYGYGLADVYAAAVVLNDEPNSTIDTPNDNATITIGESVFFTGSCEAIGNGNHTTYQWAFGNGSGIQDLDMQAPGNIVFSKTGTYSVTFTCTDALGATDSTPSSRVITVENAAVDDDADGDSTGNGNTSESSTNEDASSGESNSNSSTSSKESGGGCSLMGRPYYQKDEIRIDGLSFITTLALLFLLYVLP